MHQFHIFIKLKSTYYTFKVKCLIKSYINCASEFDHGHGPLKQLCNDLTCQSCGRRGTPECWEYIGCQSGSDSWEPQTIRQNHASEASNATGDLNACKQIICKHSGMLNHFHCIFML